MLVVVVLPYPFPPKTGPDIQVLDLRLYLMNFRAL